MSFSDTSLTIFIKKMFNLLFLQPKEGYFDTPKLV